MGNSPDLVARIGEYRGAFYGFGLPKRVELARFDSWGSTNNYVVENQRLMIAVCLNQSLIIDN